MIGTLPRGVGSVLDAPRLDPFWQAADETGAVVHIHPVFDAGDVRVNDYGLANAVGRITDALVAVRGLISPGTSPAIATRNSSCRWVRPACPSSSAGSSATSDHARLGDPAEGLALLYTDTILHDPRVLRFVAEHGRRRPHHAGFRHAVSIGDLGAVADRRRRGFFDAAQAASIKRRSRRSYSASPDSNEGSPRSPPAYRKEDVMFEIMLRCSLSPDLPRPR